MESRKTVFFIVEYTENTGEHGATEDQSSQSTDAAFSSFPKIIRRIKTMIETLITGIAIGLFAAAIIFDLIVMGSIVVEEITHHD